MRESELAARLYEYARRLEDGEQIDEPGMAGDLADAAEILDKIEKWRSAESGSWLKENRGPWHS